MHVYALIPILFLWPWTSMFLSHSPRKDLELCFGTWLPELIITINQYLILLHYYIKLSILAQIFITKYCR